MGEAWTVNSDHTEAAFIAHVKELRAKHKYITYGKPRIGSKMSMDQRALFHVWAREYAAHLLKKDRREISEGELDGMKRIIKQRFYLETKCDFMIYEIVDPFTGNSRKDYTSSSGWKVGEAFMVLEWLQLYAANDGLILEAKGQFRELKDIQNG